MGPLKNQSFSQHFLSSNGASHSIAGMWPGSLWQCRSDQACVTVHLLPASSPSPGWSSPHLLCPSAPLAIVSCHTRFSSLSSLAHASIIPVSSIALGTNNWMFFSFLLSLLLTLIVPWPSRNIMVYLRQTFSEVCAFISLWDRPWQGPVIALYGTLSGTARLFSNAPFYVHTSIVCGFPFSQVLIIKSKSKNYFTCLSPSGWEIITSNWCEVNKITLISYSNQNWQFCIPYYVGILHR